MGNQWVFIVPDHKAGYLLGGGVALGEVPYIPKSLSWLQILELVAISIVKSKRSLEQCGVRTNSALSVIPHIE